jgi:uncharacterized protein with HEPN domain
MPRDNATLLDLMKATNQIGDFLGDIPKQAFLADAKTQSSILYQLLVIGEAVKRLSPSFRAQHSHIPWTLIAGMRDHLIHAYDTVDWEEVWSTVTGDVPRLRIQIERLLPVEPTDKNG